MHHDERFDQQHQRRRRARHGANRVRRHDLINARLSRLEVGQDQRRAGFAHEVGSVESPLVGDRAAADRKGAKRHGASPGRVGAARVLEEVGAEDHGQRRVGAFDDTGVVVNHHAIVAGLRELDVGQRESGVGRARDAGTIVTPLVTQRGGPACRDAQRVLRRRSDRAAGRLCGDDRRVARSGSGKRRGGKPVRRVVPELRQESALQ